jgi:hypothetical protein
MSRKCLYKSLEDAQKYKHCLTPDRSEDAMLLHA